MNDEIVVKNCPFCGSGQAAPVLEISGWQIVCLDCHASGPRSAEENVATARWNYVAKTRAEREQENESK